jgi:hypothetical protein
MEVFVGNSREDTFVANGGGRKEWTVLVDDFEGGAVGTFTLTDVPADTTTLSAKTDWSLRRRVSVSFDVDGQAVADFTGEAMLLGGDLNGTNGINILDYTVLKTNWYTHNAVADIDGDGDVGALDYTIMKLNWFKGGDEE